MLLAMVRILDLTVHGQNIDFATVFKGHVVLHQVKTRS